MKEKTKYNLKKALVLFLAFTMIAWGVMPLSNIFATEIEAKNNGLGDISHYNAIIFGDQTSQRADVEGALAVKGNMKAPTGENQSYTICAANRNDGYYMGDRYVSNGLPALLLGGSLSKGEKAGHLIVENANSENESVVISNEQSDPNGTTMKMLKDGWSKIDIVSKPSSEIMEAFDYFKSETDKIIGDVKTLKTESIIEGNNTLKLGPSKGHNNILFSKTSITTFGDIEIPSQCANSDFVVIYSESPSITFTGSSLIYNGKELNTSTHHDATMDMLTKKIMWVFPNASTVNVDHEGVVGTVIAPNATVNANGGSINGQLIAKNFNQSGGMEMHNYPFKWNKWNENNFVVESGEVKLIKSDSKDSKKLLSGAQFDLVSASNGVANVNEVIKSGLTTDENGEITVKDLPFGEYAFVEKKAPLGYVLDSKPILFTINATNKVITVNATNNIDVSAKLIKSDLNNEKIKLPGAVFNVVKVINGKADLNQVILSNLITNKDGEIEIDSLQPGEYAFVEIKAPDNYELNKDENKNIYIFTVDNDNNQTTYPTINVKNKKIPVGTVVLTKISANSNKPLEGVTFDLIKDGVVFKSGLKTDKNGQIKVTGLESGNYSFRETATIDGYILNEKPTEVKAVDSNNADPVEFYMTNQEKPGGVKLVKKDANTGTVLQGAIFSLQDQKGNNIRTNLITDENGQIVLNDLVPGDYQFVETKAPEGYELDKTPVKFTIVVGQKEAVNIEKTNISVLTNLKVAKIDSSTKNPLSGSEFEIYSTNNINNPLKFINISSSAEYEVNNNGESTLMANGIDSSFTISKLKYGDYILKEIKAPNGYKLGKDIYIHLDRNNSYYKVGEDGKNINLDKNESLNLYKINVENEKGIVLPETGGNGFRVQRDIAILVIGINFILMINFLINKKRRIN